MTHLLFRLLAPLLVAAFLAVPAAFAASSPAAEEAVTRALDGAHRSAANRARDVFRHPKETLLFFGLEPHMHVVEITPGAGWYTEVLAPVLRERGLLYAAHFHTDEGASPFQHKSRAAFLAKLQKNPEIYDKVIVTSLRAPEHTYIAPRGSVDMVLTFRNVHNWTAAGNDEATFKAFFEALKPNGILGVVEHRARPGTSEEDMKRTGYMTESYVIQLAHRAGFRFVDKSEVNANPKDTTEWARGVWTLPPTLLGGAENRDKYIAIGESDRMTLRFVKPR